MNKQVCAEIGLRYIRKLPAKATSYHTSDAAKIQSISS